MEQKKIIKYPVGVQSFKEIREGGYTYVDKTAFVYELMQGKYYFLSRPRRFGKSLLLSTIEAYYLGRRDLFKGLALDSLTDDWEPHPVLHLDLNNSTFSSAQDLEILFDYHLNSWENTYGIESISDKSKTTSSLRFANIIKTAYEKTGKKVVILVDEYDKPLLNTIHRPELADIYRSQLKAFYANLKTMDPYIEMAMLTGVARFSKVSIFSDLNNLRDISFEQKFSAICGITSEEVDQYFKAGIETLALSIKKTYQEAREILKYNYDGYHFCKNCPDIYNPFSLVSAFAKADISDFWFDSGTPTYLVRLLENDFLDFREISPSYIDRSELESAGLLSENPLPAFYQTGYLTIKDYDRDLDRYTLDYPNKEVKQGFLKFLMKKYIPITSSARGFAVTDFVVAVRDGEPQTFMRKMESLVASVPYSEKGASESHFQNVIYLLFTLMGYFCQTEVRTSDGRIDLRVETDRYIYIFEFKIDSTSEAAMEQIREKKYWLSEAESGKQIYLIAANFNTDTARLTPPIIERP